MGTNIPIEWLQMLRFEKTYVAAQTHFDIEENLKQCAAKVDHIISTFKIQYSVKTIWNKIAQSRDQTELCDQYIEKLLKEPSLSPEFRIEFGKWNSTYRSVLKSQEDLRSLFNEELVVARRQLWSLAKETRFQEALFQLNPRFLDRIRQYLPIWETCARNKDMRRDETTMISYLSRLVGKTSVAGPFGPTLQGVFCPEMPSPINLRWKAKRDHTWGIDRREVFFSHWCAQTLADKMREEITEIAYFLPVRFNPAVNYSKGTLATMSEDLNSTFAPKYSRIGLLPMTRQLLDHVDGEKSISELANNANLQSELGTSNLSLEIQDLIKERFLINGFDIPPGTIYPIQYLSALLNRTRAQSPKIGHWQKTLLRFEELRSTYEQAELNQRGELLKELESLFVGQAGQSAQRGAGQYYADRFLVFEDCRKACEPLQFGESICKEVFESLSFALELLTPFWLTRILPIMVRTKLWLRELNANANQEGYSFLSNLARIISLRLNPKMQELTEEVQENNEAYEYLVELIELTKMARNLLTFKQKKSAEFVLDLKNPSIVQFRKRLGKLLAKGQLHLPVYASGSLLQIAAPNVEAIQTGSFLVILDSLMFGSNLHFSLIGHLTTDRSNQMAQSEDILRKLLGSSTETRLAEFVSSSIQNSKFVNWLSPGIDIEFLGTSFKERSGVASITNIKPSPTNSEKLECELDGKRTPIDFSFPPGLRLRRKLVYDHFEGHYPRIKIGKSIIQRENWKFKASQWSPAKRKNQDSFLDFLDVLRKQRASRIPNMVFVEPSDTKKNILIDFKNLFLVEVFVGMTRQNQALRISEMLPKEDEFWFSEPQSNEHFTCSLMPFLYLDPDKNYPP